jgi:hypothetical protein
MPTPVNSQMATGRCCCSVLFSINAAKLGNLQLEVNTVRAGLKNSCFLILLLNLTGLKMTGCQ